MVAYDAVKATRSSWNAMRDRCGNPNCVKFKNYGARGISVCERWSKFSTFLADMGPRPMGTSIDRINNDGNYEPNNCRWATSKEQAANQRRSRPPMHYVEFDGRKDTLWGWSALTGISAGTLYKRIISLGWPPERALTERPALPDARRQLAMSEAA